MTTPNIEELPAPETLAQMAEACETLTSLMLIIPGIDVGAWAKTLREADASMQSQAERIKELNLQVVSAFGQAQEALEERDTARAQLDALQVDDELPPFEPYPEIPSPNKRGAWNEWCHNYARQAQSMVRTKMVPLEKDAARLDWYEANATHVFSVVDTWYSRAGYLLPMTKRKSLRAAIDAAMGITGEPK